MDEGLKSPRILLVDDEPLNLDVLEGFLHGCSYELIRASSGPETLDITSNLPIDLVLLDVMMPEMDGLEVCGRLKENPATRFIPVVIVTSLSQKEDRIKSIEAGADDFITKPVDKAELLARVKSLLRLKALNDELDMKYREVVKLHELKGNLIHMIVHDFKNPLTGAAGYLDLMKIAIQKKDLDKCQRYMDNARVSILKIKSMMQDLLDLNRLEEHRLRLKIERVELDRLVDENIQELHKPIVDLELAVKVEGDRDIWLDVDKALFSRVIGNILSNAIRHSPPGGEVLFEVEKSPGDVLFSISNNGPSLPEEALEKVFEKFYQVEDKESGRRSGVGLGLAFCDMVCKAHGGSIRALNNPGGGCRFIINLPLAPLTLTP